MTAPIGSLRRRVRLESLTREPDGLGGAYPIWQEIAALWASIEARSGREAVSAGRLAGAVSHHITIRHREGVTPAMRFRLGGRVFHILAVLEDGKRRRLTCQCEERDL